MLNIKQNFLKIILSFTCLVFLAGCETTKKEIKLVELPPSEPETIEVAILMPLTGEHSVIGQQYNSLIKLGLEDGLKTYVHVTSYDSADERQIQAAINKIIARKTKIILGPLYSEHISLIASKAKANNIIMITMSNNPVIADNKLFVFGHAPLKQLSQIINYFTDNNYKNFITLLPAGQHSQTINKIIQSIMLEKNTTLVRSEFYAHLPESIDKSTLTVSNSVDNLNEIEDNLTKPIIYLSDDSKNLPLVFNSIHKYSLDKKATIIGDNRIDIEYPENINIIFTGSLNILNHDIVERAKNLGINHLSFMHAMAYDLGRMTATYICSKFTEERFLSRLNSKEPYIGISGNIHFIDSIAQRQYDIIKKEDGVYNTLYSK